MKLAIYTSSLYFLWMQCSYTGEWNTALHLNNWIISRLLAKLSHVRRYYTFKLFAICWWLFLYFSICQFLFILSL